MCTGVSLCSYGAPHVSCQVFGIDVRLCIVKGVAIGLICQAFALQDGRRQK